MQSFIVSELDPHVNSLALNVTARACKPFQSKGQGHELATTSDRTTDHRGPGPRGPEPMTTGAKEDRSKARVGRGHGARARKQGPRRQVPEIMGAMPQKFQEPPIEYAGPKRGMQLHRKWSTTKKEVCSRAEIGRPNPATKQVL